jgi:hypothetical protein
MFKTNNFEKDSTKPNSLFKDNTLINYDIKNQTNYDNLNSLKVETQVENIDLSDLESDESSLKSDYSLPESYSEMSELYPDYNYDIEDERTDETEAKTKQIPEDNYETEDERTDETETKTKDFSEDNYDQERTDETETKMKDISEDNYETEDEITDQTKTKTKDFSEDNYDDWLDYPNLSKQNNDFYSIQNATNGIVAMLNDVFYSAKVSNSTKASMSNDVKEKTKSIKSVLNETDAFDSIQRTKSKGSMLKDSDIESLQKTANVIVSTMSKQNNVTNIDTNDRQSMSQQNGDYVSVQKPNSNERQSLLNETDYFDSVKKTTANGKESMSEPVDDVDHVQKANAYEKQTLLNETDYFDSVKKTSYGKESMSKHTDDVDHVQRATNSKDSMLSDQVKPLQKNINDKQSMFDVQRTPKNKESMFSETDLKNNSSDFVERMETEFEPRKLIVSVNDLKLQFQSLIDEWKTKLQTDQTNSTAAPGKTHYSGSLLM